MWEKAGILSLASPLLPTFGPLFLGPPIPFTFQKVLAEQNCFGVPPSGDLFRFTIGKACPKVNGNLMPRVSRCARKQGLSSTPSRSRCCCRYQRARCQGEVRFQALLHGRATVAALNLKAVLRAFHCLWVSRERLEELLVYVFIPGSTATFGRSGQSKGGSGIVVPVPSLGGSEKKRATALVATTFGTVNAETAKIIAAFTRLRPGNARILRARLSPLARSVVTGPVRSHGTLETCPLGHTISSRYMRRVLIKKWT